MFEIKFMLWLAWSIEAGDQLNEYQKWNVFYSKTSICFQRLLVNKGQILFREKLFKLGASKQMWFLTVEWGWRCCGWVVAAIIHGIKGWVHGIGTVVGPTFIPVNTVLVCITVTYVQRIYIDKNSTILKQFPLYSVPSCKKDGMKYVTSPLLPYAWHFFFTPVQWGGGGMWGYYSW